MSSELSQENQRKTLLGKLTQSILSNLWEILDQVGQSLMGELWPQVYSAVQDAIALGILLFIQGSFGFWITGKNFSNFRSCYAEDPSAPSFYACLIIVAGDFGLWIVLAGRFIARFCIAFMSIKKYFNDQKKALKRKSI